MDIKNKAVVRICLFAFFLNFILFAVKLYVGLSSNIISIYSDGINNLFDSLSGMVTVICFAVAFKSDSIGKKGFISKTEQLLTLGLSVVIALSGVVFLYNSLERLMYPTPMWFTMGFLWTLVGTAVCKLVMMFLFKRQYRKTGSQVLEMMALDSRLDFFVNLVTLATLIMSKLEFYAFDAFGGIVISVIITVSGVKMLIGCVRLLVGLPEKNVKEKFVSLLCDFGIDKENSEVDFFFTDDKKAYIKTRIDLSKAEKESLEAEALEKTGIKIYLLK